jgi:hypothetical protein
LITVSDTESAAAEDGFDYVFALVDLLSGGPVPDDGYVRMWRGWF